MSDRAPQGYFNDRPAEQHRTPDLATPLTAESARALTEFSLYRKTARTLISDRTFPPGTTYATPEGLRAEDEDTRAALDVQGGVYPIRESVFRATYALDATLNTTRQPVAETALRHIRDIASGDGGDEASRSDPHNALATIVLFIDGLALATREPDPALDDFAAFTYRVAESDVRVYDGMNPDASMALDRFRDEARRLLERHPALATREPDPAPLDVIRSMEAFAAARERDVRDNRDAPDNINEAVAATVRGWIARLAHSKDEP